MYVNYHVQVEPESALSGGAKLLMRATKLKIFIFQSKFLLNFVRILWKKL